MTTAPYALDARELIARSHRQAFTVRATHPDWADPLDLDVESCTVGWDETRAPRVIAELTCRVPSDPAALDLLDPRTGVRLEFDAGYIRAGGARDVQTIADLGLRDRRVNRPGNTVRLEAHSDEALIIDNAPSAGYAVSAASIPAAITSVIRAVFAAATPTVTLADATAVTVDPVTDKWSTIDDLADRIGADVYDDGLRGWWIVPRPAIAGVSSLSLKTGPGGTIESSDSTLARGAWFNVVFLEYAWRDSGGTDQRVEAVVSASGGPFDPAGPAMARTFHDRRDVPTTQAQANAAASAVLRRCLSRGRSFQLRSVAAYWLRPGMTATVLLPTGPQERHLVTAVLFDLVTGSMTVTTRLPDDTIIITGE